ncbi:hypothetical protein GW17_00056308 [Ensete ventricosum]|nr:hypothetical protein GW17_00056308 [Ensete ventricosum]
MNSRPFDPISDGYLLTSDIKYTIVFWSLFLLMGIFIPIASNFIISYSPTHHAYNVVI